MGTSVINDMARSVLNIPGYTIKEKEDLMDALYEPTVYGLMEAIPYRGFSTGFLRTALPSNKAILNFSAEKTKFEFQNTINYFKKVKQKNKRLLLYKFKIIFFLKKI